MKKYLLYHRIGAGGEDSATVRQFLVEQDITGDVEFQNVGYDKARSALEELTGSDQAPVMLVNSSHAVLKGCTAIIEWLKVNHT